MIKHVRNLAMSASSYSIDDGRKNTGWRNGTILALGQFIYLAIGCI